jgi:hypothetical protein
VVHKRQDLCFFLGLRLSTTTRKPRNDLTVRRTLVQLFWSQLFPNIIMMVRGFLMWNLIVYRLIVICTRFASGCRIGELEPFDTVRVHAHIFSHALVGANLPSGPLSSLLVGDLVVGLANQTVMSRCLTGVAAIASPTYCAQSAESMVPESASLIRSPVRDHNVDDGLCSALLPPKPPSSPCPRYTMFSFLCDVCVCDDNTCTLAWHASLLVCDVCV